MPFIKTSEGYESTEGEGLKIPTVAGLFSVKNLVRRLYAAKNWSVAHIASHLKIPQKQVKEFLKKE